METSLDVLSRAASLVHQDDEKREFNKYCFSDNVFVLLHQGHGFDPQRVHEHNEVQDRYMFNCVITD